MSLGHGASIVRDGLVFYFDALNPKCYSGSGTEFRDLITKTVGNSSIISPATLSINDGHLLFTNPNVSTRVACISFPTVNGITPPTGSIASWSFWSYFIDQGSVDHPNIGWETSNGWDGQNGFVFGTGWNIDGPRWGIGGTAYAVYTTANPDYQNSIWQNWTITFDGNSTNGLKTYLNSVLIDERTPTTTTINGNTNNLIIGATNSRGGNWGGYMDQVLMWNKKLSLSEVKQNFEALRGRYEI